MSNKGALKKYGVSILLTVAIIGIVFLIGPVAALVLSIDGVTSGPGSVMFNLNFDIGPGELLPGGFAVTINGDSCAFDVDANPLGGALCSSLSCEVLKKSSSIFGKFNANGVFDNYGYGYGYQYGYGYENGELRYKCTHRQPCGQSGKLTISFSTMVDGVTFTSPSTSVTIVTQPCGGRQGGGSGGSGSQGHCCDPVVNFGKWHCCQKAVIARIQCCAQPQHPDCAQYCKLLECISPYVMDSLTGRCVMSSQLPPGFGRGNGNDQGISGTPINTELGDGNDLTGDASSDVDGTGGFSFGSHWPWWILLLLILAGIIYWRSRRRRSR
jgi:hypothetical protein